MSPGGATSKGTPSSPSQPGRGAESRQRAGAESRQRAGRSPRRDARDGLGPIVVTWHQAQRRPVAFVWRGRRYRVERLLETWVVETGWWKEDGLVSRSYWRVRAEGHVFDLRYDRVGKTWTLEQALN